MEILLLLWLAFGFVSAYIAGTKNRSKGAWFAIGMLFGIFGILAAVIMPAQEEGK